MKQFRQLPEPADALRERWRAWEAMPYPSVQHPPGSDAGTVVGEDLALADGDVGRIFFAYFVEGRLTLDDRHALPLVIDGLERAVPTLAGSARDYFDQALRLLRDIRDATRE